MKCFRIEDNKIMPGLKVTDEIMMDDSLKSVKGLLERASLKFLAPVELATAENQSALNNYDEAMMLAFYPCFIAGKDTDDKDVFILQYSNGGSHKLGGIRSTRVVFLNTPGHSYCLLRHGGILFDAARKTAAVCLNGEIKIVAEAEAGYLQENLAREHRLATGQTKMVPLGVPGKAGKKHSRKIKIAKNSFTIEVIAQSSVQQPYPMPPPDWRWLYACKFYTNPKQADIYKDFALFKFIKYMELQDIVIDNIPTLDMNPLAIAMNIWRDNTGYACLRHCIEACLLANASDSEIAEYLGSSMTPAVIFYYKKLFFELPIGNNEFWLEQYILGPAQKLSDDEFLSGYIWKSVSMECGLEVLTKSLLSGRADDKHLNQLILHAIKQMKRATVLLSSNPVSKNKFALTAKYLQGLLMKKVEEQPEKENNEMKELFDTLSKVARSSIKMTTAASPPLPSSERYDSVPKFKDDDLERFKK